MASLSLSLAAFALLLCETVQPSLSSPTDMVSNAPSGIWRKVYKGQGSE